MMEYPRKCWINISNEDLICARDEYRRLASMNNKYNYLLQTADNIDDEIKRRTYWNSHAPVMEVKK
jgi:hypothetical protein